MATTPVGLSIGEVAAHTGLTVHALRFYEKEGLLLHPVRRDSAGRRQYSPEDVEWLRKVCLKLKASDMPLADIRRYTELARAGLDDPANAAERLRLMQRHRDRLECHIAELNSALDLVNYKVKLYTAAARTADDDHAGAR